MTILILLLPHKAAIIISLNINLVFIVLTLIIIIFILINEIKIIPNHINTGLYKAILRIITLTLFLFFRLDRLWLFYFSYEASLIPIILLIIGWGYQTERFLASLIMLIYIVLGSFPLLIMIFWINLTKSRDRLTLISLWIMPQKTSPLPQALIVLTFITTFLIKFPIFLFHLWLPKAHVEAPLRGSIILAGILLKIAGYGLIIIKFIINSSNIHTILALFRLWGGILTSLFCLYQIDIKVLIAYFSVGHIRFAIAALMAYPSEALEGIIVIIVAHGFCSAGLFNCAYNLYLDSHSRNIIINKGGLRTARYFRKILFLILIANMRTPPTANFFGEVKSAAGLLSLNFAFLLPFIVIIIITVVCSILMYSFSQNSKTLLIPINSQQKLISIFRINPFILLLFLIPLLSNKLI